MPVTFHPRGVNPGTPAKCFLEDDRHAIPPKYDSYHVSLLLLLPFIDIYCCPVVGRVILMTVECTYLNCSTE